ncbi:MAG TPA: ABC transporter ATP-binding protein [Roseiarcus sp.]|nr:ABC transporter ATP-binding protein [Roseiarcus sp.]
MSRAGALAPLDVYVAKKRLTNASGQTIDVVRDLSLRLDTGQVGALIGPSGCGKTTLMRIIAGLDERFEGAVKRPQGPLSMAFQEPRLLPWRSVEDNIRLAVPRVGEKELGVLLDTLGLGQHRSHFPGELSLGLARRVALARAFAVKPALLLLDEPFVSLDAPLALAMQRKLAALVKERAITTVLVTHDVSQAVRLANRIFVLSPRPARVVGEIRVESPHKGMGAEDARSVEKRVEGLLVQATAGLAIDG